MMTRGIPSIRTVIRDAIESSRPRGGKRDLLAAKNVMSKEDRPGFWRRSPNGIEGVKRSNVDCYYEV
jgi:hypothetical protein